MTAASSSPVVAALPVRGFEARAGLVMFLSVVCTSLLPVLVTEGGGREAPFLFNFLWRLGLVLGILVSFGLWGRWFLKAFFAQPGAWRLVLLAGPTLGTLAGVLNSVSFAGYSWATAYLDVFVVAALFECWPIIFVLVTGWHFRGRAGGRSLLSVLLSLLPLLVIAFFGFALVVLSQAVGVSGQAGLPSWAGLLAFLSTDWVWWGIVIVLMAACCSSFGAFSFAWGRDLVLAWEAASGSGFLTGGRVSGISGTARLSFLFWTVILGYCLFNLLGALGSLVFGLVRGEDFGSVTWSTLWVVLVGAAVLHAAASLLLRWANLFTLNLGVNAMLYLGLPLTLVWFGLLGRGGGLKLDYLLMGAASIVMVNVLAQFRGGRLARFSILPAWLWCGGTLLALAAF